VGKAPRGKARKARSIKVRRKWKIDPKTRVVEDRTKFVRARERASTRRRLREEI